MEVPLTKDQISRLQEISKLPQAEQQEALNKLLNSLTSEQRKFLEDQQSGHGCIFCNIAQGKTKSYVIYEDNQFIAVLDIYPATLGHVIIIPKNHISSFSQIPASSSLLQLLQAISNRMKNDLKLPGFNILLAEGRGAGQKIDHLLIHIIPRYDKDGLDFSWKPQEVEDNALEEVYNKLKINEQFSMEEPEISKEKESIKKKRSYRTKRRIP